MSETVRKLWKDYSLSIVLLACFILTGLQAWSGWRKFAAPASADGLGDDGYVWEFLAATFENWRSARMRPAVGIRIPPAPRDGGAHLVLDFTAAVQSNDRMEAKLDEVQAKLNELSGSDAHKRKSRKKTAAV